MKLRKPRTTSTAWVKIAQAANEELVDVPRGQVTEAYEKFAKRFQQTGPVVRRMQKAYEFVWLLSDGNADLSDRLRLSSYQAVEKIWLWYKHDKESALNAAYRYVSGEISIPELAAGRKKSKMLGTWLGELSFRLKKSDLLAEARKAIGVATYEITGSYDFSDRPFVPFLLKETGSERRWIIVAAWPVRSVDSFSKLVSPFMVELAAGTFLGWESIMIVPEDADPEKFRTAAKKRGLSPVTVTWPKRVTGPAST